MALRPAPKRKSVDYQKLDDLQKEIFGSEQEGSETLSSKESENNTGAEIRPKQEAQMSKFISEKNSADKIYPYSTLQENQNDDSLASEFSAAGENSLSFNSGNSLGEGLSDMETIAARISSSKAGQGRSTTRPFSLPRTLIIDTTRLKAKFRTIDEQFTQNVIIDFLLREALAAVTPENYKDLRATAYEFVKRPEETTRRSLTVTEDVVYQMSELKAAINLETGRKYPNDEIFSTLLALAVSWLYRNGVLT